jgi:hypothetical protein
MDLQDPQSTKYDAQRARAKLMEAAYTVSVVHGNHMTCSAGHAGTLALKAELTAVGDSPLAAAEAAGDGSKGLAERAGGLVAAARAAIEAAREATLPEECTAAELRALGRLKAVSRTIIAGFPCGSCTDSLVMPIAAQIWAQMQPKFPCGSGSHSSQSASNDRADRWRRARRALTPLWYGRCCGSFRRRIGARRSASRRCTAWPTAAAAPRP